MILVRTGVFRLEFAAASLGLLVAPEIAVQVNALTHRVHQLKSITPDVADEKGSHGNDSSRGHSPKETDT